MTNIENKDKEILKLALEDECRKKHDLCVIFVTADKHPGLKKWQEHAIEGQTEEDIEKLYRTRGKGYSGYSYFTGVSGLVDLDFDWEWAYHLAIKEFGTRMDTRTIKTPNGGYRALFICENAKDYLEYKNRPPKVEIHGAFGKHVIVHGLAKDDNGDLHKYEVTKDIDIKTDNQIIPDLIEFLHKINQKCRFLEYKCIASKLKHKKNELTQEQRTSIGAFFVAESLDKDCAVNFFMTCPDFDYETSKDHMDRLYQKGFKYPTCEMLRKNFSWDQKNCKGCLRNKESKNSPSKKNEGLDLRQITHSEVFTHQEHDGKYYYTDVIDVPIFEVEGKIQYAITLSDVRVNNDSDTTSKTDYKKIVGFYGSKTGYGLEPLTFNSSKNSAIPIATVSTINNLVNKYQGRTIEECIKESLNNPQTIIETPEIIYTKPAGLDVGPIPDEVADKLKYYIKLSSDLQYYIAACFVIGTYMFPLFATFGYLIVSGEKGAGKGTFLDLMQRLCWNSTKKMISPSEATIFRIIKEQLPTMIIDEYHRIIEKPNIGAAVESILESGYEKGGVVPRTETIKEKGIDSRIVVNFPVYCPKVLATRKQVEADNKGIKIIIPKKIHDDVYAERKRELYNDVFFKNIRKSLIKWVLSNQTEISKAYETIKPTDRLGGREFNVWLPILSVAKVAFPEKYDKLVKFVEYSINKTRTDSWENEDRILTALNSLLQVLNDGKRKLKNPSYIVTNKEIKKAYHEAEGENISHLTIKSALDNMNLIGYQDTGKYYIEKEKLKKLLIERGHELHDNPIQFMEQGIYHDLSILPDSEIDNIYIVKAYDIILDCAINVQTFLNKLESTTDLDNLECIKFFNYLKAKEYIEFDPDNNLEPEDKLRELVKEVTTKVREKVKSVKISAKQ